MAEVNQSNFGLLIAYLLPGTIVIASIADRSSMIRAWLGASTTGAPTVGGFLFITLAAVFAGLTTSTIRWLLLDSLHHRTGIRPPNWKFAVLQENLTAFEGAVENHYRYHQFYGNTLIAIVLAMTANPQFAADSSTPLVARSIGAVIVVLFYFASRDSLRKYYVRTNAILSSSRTTKERNHD